MQISNYPSPPLSDFEKMDRGVTLPPITTHLAGLFPKQRPNTPPISPDDLRASQQQYSAKRKRSDDQVANAVESSQAHQQSKRPYYDWRRDQAEHARPADRLALSLDTPDTTATMSSRPSARSPPSRHGEINAQQSPVDARSTVAYFDRNQPGPSPRSATARVDDETFYRPHPPSAQALAKPTSADPAAASQYASSRILPPIMHHPSSPRGSLDRKYSGEGNGKFSLPPLEPSMFGQPSPASRYPFPGSGSGSFSGTSSARHSMTEFSSPYPESRQTRAPSFPQPLHSSYERRSSTDRARAVYDPVRPQLSNPWQSTEGTQSRALPPMPGLNDPIPPRDSAPEPASTSSRPASHSLEAYRFDAATSADHPARRRRGNLPKEATARLNQWFAQHAAYPYPKEEEKQALQAQTGLTLSQIGNWFINARRRRRPSATNRLIDPAQHITAVHYPPHDRAPYDYPGRLPPYSR